MADLEYGGGGGGGGYYPPFFDPNNPMGGGGGGSGAPVLSPEQQAYVNNLSYAVSHVSTLDPSFNADYFTNNFNAQNPYTRYYDATTSNVYASIYYNIGSFGNEYEIIGYATTSINGRTYTDPIYRVYDNAYKQFEAGTTAAQNSYLSQQTDAFNTANNKAESDLIASYGNVKTPSLKNDIATLADLNSKVAELQFQDDITRYLNRVTDSSNINAINDLKNQIAALQNSLSDRLMDYWRQQEVIRKKENEFFTWDFAWLSDPYFGRGGGDKIYQEYLQAQAYLNNNIAMIADGSIYDWLAGGIYLNAVMPGGEMSAGYMPNDYYSVGLQYQVAGTNLNEGGANAFPWDSMAGGASFGLNSNGRAAYKVLEL